LETLCCDFCEVTDAKGGETLKRFPVQKGDLLVTDRGFAHVEGIVSVVQRGGDVLLRLNWSNVPLEDAQGKKISILVFLRTLSGRRCGEGVFWVRCPKTGKRVQVRICAKRVEEDVARHRRKRLRREARRQGRRLRRETLETARYFWVLTTVPASVWSAEQVVEIYRRRWQIELTFKRLKSLLRLWIGCPR
jgi:hypothetical protein